MTSYQYENQLYTLGLTKIAGVDEAGRGPLAGPVVAAACILPQALHIHGLTDSKKLSASKREKLYQQLTEDPAVCWAVAMADSQRIDRINILQATLQAMKEAVQALTVMPDAVLVDGNHLPVLSMPSHAIIDGDALSFSIAAASVLAKVTRDRMMDMFHGEWPVYGFNQHKGYGTKQHLSALSTYGLCPIHRRSFAPCKVDKVNS